MEISVIKGDGGVKFVPRPATAGAAAKPRGGDARARAESRAKAMKNPIPSAVRKNSVKRMLAAKKLMSKAGSLEKSGGFGNTPWVKAKPMTSSPMNQSKMVPVQRAVATVGKLAA